MTHTAIALESANFYERLGLDSSASAEEIKRAYRTLLRQYPPERAPEEFKRLREAYETLGNPRSREEYDQRPDPVVEQWLNTGHQAMKAENYPLAERYFKQVLLQEPGLSFVRNLLGLCLLYQDEPAKAAVQFERLLTEPDAPSAWFANAGHAYRRTARYADAEQAFKEAVRRATDNPVDYVVGLANVYLDQDAPGKAVRLLEDAINADGVVDIQDLGYFTKLLEVWIRQGDRRKMADVLDRMSRSAADEEQRRLLAWKLGVIAQQLIVAGGYRFVPMIAQRAQALQPKDQDYVALEQVAKRLEQNDFAALGPYLATHPSFQAGGWLVNLGVHVRQYMADHRVYAQMERVSAAPSLGTINGVGTTVYGERDYDEKTRSYVTTLYFVVLFIPIVPVACYRVIRQSGNSWSFLGTVPFSKREKRHWLVVAILTLIAIVWAVANSQVESSYSSSAAAHAGRPYVADQYIGQPSGTTPSRPPGGLAGQPSAEPVVVPVQRPEDDEAWYASERARIATEEADISALDGEMSTKQDELQSLKRRIADIENGFGLYSVSDPEYDRLLNRHNAVVREYNGVLHRRQAMYEDYKLDLQIFNAKVDAHNARLRR